MKRRSLISFDRAIIIIGWIVANGILWIPVVHGMTSTDSSITYSFGLIGYFEQEQFSTGDTSSRIVPGGLWVSLVVTFLWTAASIRWWQLDSRNALKLTTRYAESDKETT